MAVYDFVAEEVARLFSAEAGIVCRFEGERAVPVGWWGTWQGRPTVVFPLGGRGALSQVHRSAQPGRVDDHGLLGDGPVAVIASTSSYTSGVAAPIRVGARLWGAVLVASAGPEPLPLWAEERLSDIAELISLAIANAADRDESA